MWKCDFRSRKLLFHAFFEDAYGNDLILRSKSWREIRSIT